MEVINYLLANNLDWDKLKEEFGIKTTHYPEDDLHVLNYSQIDSPKTHPIVLECRGLVLDYDLNIVARTFDRFFNYGEAGTEIHSGKVFAWGDKKDGSFIKVYMHGGVWKLGTRGTAFAEANVGFEDGLTFLKLAYRAAGVKSDYEFNQLCKDSWFVPGVTYMFELTARENRVVTQYETPELTFLGARENQTGAYLPYSETHARMNPVFKHLSIVVGTPEEMVGAANNLKNLEEGYVGYQDGAPIMKIKADAYVAVHHLRGEGLNPKRISELVATGEQDEYLTYFPEDAKHIDPYTDAEATMLFLAEEAYNANCEIVEQKAFALKVKDIPNHDLMFMARRNKTGIYTVYKNLPLNAKATRIREAFNHFNKEATCKQ